MATATDTRPEYLGLLNAISLGESANGVSLTAWANATSNEDLACVLRTVAARESSHGDVFCRRIAEMGHELVHKADPEGAAKLAKRANPRVSDIEKIGPRQTGGIQFLDDLEKRIESGEFDPLANRMMTWYLAEERDSVKMLDEAYDCVRSMDGAGSNGAQSAIAQDSEAIMACMTAGFDRVEKALLKIARAR